MEKEENLLSWRLVCELEVAGAHLCIFRKNGEERKGGRARATQRRGEGGGGGGSHSEREDSSVMLLDVICSPRTSPRDRASAAGLL